MKLTVSAALLATTLVTSPGYWLGPGTYAAQDVASALTRFIQNTTSWASTVSPLLHL